jgi:hypothetical protein
MVRSGVPILLMWTLMLLLALSCAKRGADGTNGSTQPKSFAFQGKPSSTITFLSTQMNPVEEAGKMRNAILKDFPGKVDFRPNDNSYLFRQINSMLQGDPSASILVGADSRSRGPNPPYIFQFPRFLVKIAQLWGQNFGIHSRQL